MLYSSKSTDLINSLMRSIKNTTQAPAAIGPYNQATIANGIAYISGQIALDPQTGELQMDNIQAETDQVLRNLGAVLEACGSGYEQVLKCTIFMVNMNDYTAINEVYARYFPAEQAPAREAVAVSSLPKYVNVEISCIALVPQA